MARSFLIAGLALGLLALPATADSSRKPRRSACQRLRAKHDLAPAGKVKLVVRHGELKGCVLPRGAIRHIAFRSHDTTSDSEFTVRHVKGAIALIDGSNSNQYGSNDVTTVYNLRVGRVYTIAATCTPILTGYCPTPSPQTTAPSAFVNSTGRSAAAIAAGDSITIMGFNTTGRPSQFDSGSSSQIPPSSLRLHRRTITWTHSGVPKAAKLPR